MILIIHIIFALASLIYSAFVAVAPTPRKLKFSYSFMSGTFASGVLLIFEREVNIAQVCISGLAYTAFVLASTLVAKRKLASMIS